MEQKKYDNIECLDECGLKCDNPKCDWQDKTISFADLENHINRRCPKCGQNVLTEKDFENAMITKLTADYINTLSPEELKEMSGPVDIEKLKSNPMFENAKGLEFLKTKERVIVHLNTHNE